jgi:hypothetical protein
MYSEEPQGNQKGWLARLQQEKHRRRALARQFLASCRTGRVDVLVFY